MPVRVGFFPREGGLLSPCSWTCGCEIYSGDDTPILAIGKTAAISAPAPDLQYVFSVEDEAIASCEAVSTEAGDSAAVQITGLNGGTVTLTAVLHAGGVAIGSGTCTVTVSGGKVAIPSPDLYQKATGEALTLLTDSSDYTVTGENTAADAGIYTVTVTLKNQDASWSDEDGTTDPLTFTWCIYTASASHENAAVYLCGDRLLVTSTERQSSPTVFAAWYDGSGRLLDVRTASVSDGVAVLTNAAPETGDALGVFILDEESAPVCAALSVELS